MDYARVDEATSSSRMGLTDVVFETCNVVAGGLGCPWDCWEQGVTGIVMITPLGQLKLTTIVGPFPSSWAIFCMKRALFLTSQIIEEMDGW